MSDEISSTFSPWMVSVPRTTGILDTVLRFVDQGPRGSNGSIRPPGARLALKSHLGDIPLNRLAYESQCRDCEADRNEYNMYSLLSLLSFSRCLPDQDAYRDRLEEIVSKLSQSGIQFLTLIDAAASLPIELQSETVRGAAEILRTLYCEYHKVKASLCRRETSALGAMQYKKETISKDLHKCRVWIFFLQLAVYDNRLHGRSPHDDFNSDMREAYLYLRAPPQYGSECLPKLRAKLAAFHDEICSSYNEDARLEWVGLPMSVEDISRPLEQDTDEKCAICQCAVTPPGVCTPCRHVYCSSCLEHWIHAKSKGSHTCCVCRAELFPAPEYRLSDAVDLNYAAEMDWIGDRMDEVDNICALYAKFENELDFEAGVWNEIYDAENLRPNGTHNPPTDEEIPG